MTESEREAALRACTTVRIALATSPLRTETAHGPAVVVMFRDRDLPELLKMLDAGIAALRRPILVVP